MVATPLWGGATAGVGVGRLALVAAGSARTGTAPPLPRASSRLLSPCFAFVGMASGSAGTGKRVRDEIASDNDFVSRSDLEELLATLKQNIGNDVKAAVEQSVVANNTELIRKYDAQVQRRFADHDASLKDITDRCDKIDSDQVKMRDDIKRMQDALALAEAAPAQVRTALESEEFDRPPDLTLVRLNTSELVARAAVLESISPWMSEAGLSDDHWDLLGDQNGLARNFVVRFSGPDALAARRARKCLAIRRMPDGTWRPNPRVNTPMNRSVEIYVSPDKSPRQLRTEQGGRKLLKAFRAVHPTKSVHLDKREGVVNVEWKACAKVLAHPEVGVFTIQWNAAVVAELAIQKVQIKEAFDADTGARSNIQWSI